MNNHTKFLKRAIRNARKSVEQGGFPAGAVLVLNDKIISEGLSLGGKNFDPTGHGEGDAIRKACRKLKTMDLSGSILYASMESCVMCFSAANWANISKIVFASRKEIFPKDFYEGKNVLKDLNQKNLRKVGMVFVEGFEEEVKKIVSDFLNSSDK